MSPGYPENGAVTRMTPHPRNRGNGAPRRAVRRRYPLLILGGLMVAAGLAFLAWFGYQAYLEPVVDEAGTAQQVVQIKEQWAGPEAKDSTVPGNAIALLRVPDFGPDFEVAVVSGTTEYALSVGVGWFPDTAEPGAIGNFAVAGHRGKSGPFVPLPDLKPGAEVIVETRTAIYTYKLTNTPKDLTVDHTATWVLDSVPGRPKEKPTKALITLITCANFFRSPERTIAFGELVDTVKK